jgi:hypothetical protein
MVTWQCAVIVEDMIETLDTDWSLSVIVMIYKLVWVTYWWGKINLPYSFFIHIYINKFNKCYRTPKVFLINIRICYCQLWQPSWMEFEPFRYISKWGPSKKTLFIFVVSEKKYEQSFFRWSPFWNISEWFELHPRWLP